MNKLDNSSIYDGRRLALPDEVWNFNRGDGVEKAILMASVLANKNPGKNIRIVIAGENIVLEYGGRDFRFVSKKGFRRIINIADNSYTTENL